MDVRVSLGLCVIVLSGLNFMPAADWPQWRGPKREGWSGDTGLAKNWPSAGPSLLWKIDDVAKLGVGYGAPSVVGNKLFILGADNPKKEAQEYCVCLDARTGKSLWKTPLNTTPGNFNDNWGGGPRSSPTVDGEYVYVLGATGDLLCLAARDGKLVWRKNLVKDFGGSIPTWGYSESVLIDGEKLVCTPGSRGGMIALNKRTGETIWQCKDFSDDAGYSSIIAATIADVPQYIQQTMKSGIGVRASDGKLLWKAGEIGRRVAVIPTPIVHDNQVFYTAGYGAGCELVTLKPDGNGGITPTLAYTKNNVLANHHGGVIRVGKYIYGYSDTQGGWVCIEYQTGDPDPVWKSTKLGKGSISYADGYFYCYAEKDGTLARIEASPEGWRETGRFTIPALSKLRPNSGKVWAHPVIANGKLYLRDYELLYCYDLQNPGA